MNTLNVGIIGCGNISGIYLQNIPAFHGLSLRACADIKSEIAQAQAERHGIEARTVDQLLASDDIHLVVNLTIPSAHFGVSLAALTAGKHVFSEKPLAVDFEQGRQTGGRGGVPWSSPWLPPPTHSWAPADASPARSSMMARSAEFSPERPS